MSDSPAPVLAYELVLERVAEIPRNEMGKVARIGRS